MERLETGLPGCYLLRAKVVRDHRGMFAKTFHQEVFAELGLPTAFAEEYYSVSRRHVLRGMHFQVPPHDHAKMVYCLRGGALDVFVDLRIGSPTYGKFASVPLSAEGGEIVLLPPGIAHGFLALDDEVVMQYKVTSVYQPESDCGIRWDSFGFQWPVSQPVLSPRDEAFPALADFRSPFEYRPC